MASNKNNKLVLSTFINELTNFIDLLCCLVPDSKEIQQNKTYYISCKKVNPRAIIISWQTDVAEHFKEPIEQRNLQFFVEHDYQNDPYLKEYSSFIVKMFENLKHNLVKLQDKDKEITMTYIQNISKISKLYII